MVVVESMYTTPDQLDVPVSVANMLPVAPARAAVMGGDNLMSPANDVPEPNTIE